MRFNHMVILIVLAVVVLAFCTGCDPSVEVNDTELADVQASLDECARREPPRYLCDGFGQALICAPYEEGG